MASNAAGTRRTKIVATLGPESESPEVIEALVVAGMDVARLGLAHGDPSEHIERMSRVRAVSEAQRRPIGLLADLPGPKVRTGPFPDGGVFLAEGTMLEIRPGDEPSDGAVIHVEYETLCADVDPGDEVILGDGAVVLRMETERSDCFEASVLHGGRVQGRPGAHLPSDKVRIGAPTPEDLELVEIVADAGVDFIAISFVRDADDIRRVRRAIGRRSPRIVAKIETRAAVEHLAEIVEVADAVMVARGDLGNECAIEDVPHLQKEIVRTCVARGVPVITATQMLESMVHAPGPTRAEASDVANAVFDGTDALMLSGETAIGHDPANAVATMARIASRAEREADYLQWGGRLGRVQQGADVTEETRITAAMTHAAWRAVTELEVAAVLCCTRRGATARAMARFRPPARLLGLSPDGRTVQQLTLSWGVEPMRVGEYETTDEMVWCVVEAAVAEGRVAPGDLVAVLAGAPDAAAPATDVLRIVRVD